MMVCLTRAEMPLGCTKANTWSGENPEQAGEDQLPTPNGDEWRMGLLSFYKSSKSEHKSWIMLTRCPELSEGTTNYRT